MNRTKIKVIVTTGVFLIFMPFLAVGQDDTSSTVAGRKELFRVQEQIQQLEKEIRNTTAGGLSKEIKNIPTKTKYTKEERRRIVSVQKRFGAESKATITRDGWVEVPYGENPVLNCSLKGFCTVALEPGERAISIAVTDTSAWNFDKKYYGPNGIIEVIVLNPRFSDSYAQMDVMTDRGRFYTLFLDSSHLVEMEDGSIPIHSMKMRFNYQKNVDDMSVSYRQSSDELARKIVAIMKEGSDTGEGGHGFDDAGGFKNKSRREYDTETNYEIDYVGGARGEKTPSWKPVRAYSDNIGNSTYIELPRNYNEIPSVFVVGRDNKNKAVNARLKGKNQNIIEIDGVHDRIVLRQIDSGINKKYLTAFEIVRVL